MACVSRPRVREPHGLDERLTMLRGLRGVVTVRLHPMPHGLRLIRKPLAATGETHLLDRGGALDLGGHRGRGAAGRGAPAPPLSPGWLLEIVAGARGLVPHTGTPMPSCLGVGPVSRARAGRCWG